MGELRKFYSLANVVFVGRSLVPMGGSDPMEVAALGKPIVTGAHMENFAAPVAALVGAGALVQARDSDAVSRQVGQWLNDAGAARQSGASGQRVVRENQGATQRTLDRLVAFLDVSEP